MLKPSQDLAQKISRRIKAQPLEKIQYILFQDALQMQLGNAYL